ncbi:uncharacterized protein LOC119170446 isoform X6 [Rhipicephalus microplus]|uniref:uncharacterized protein LOC119170446 isoform X6 n=1 Tax=Rhipicephalus microplus TaxID=6941 RepID=UPI003F6D22AF
MFDDSKDYVIFTTRTLPRAHRKVCFEMRELHTSTAEAVDIPQWSSWCQQDLGAPTRLLWPVCRGHGRRVSASLGLLEVRGVTLTCSGHSLHPLPAGRPEHEDSSPLSRRTALPVVHLWIALPGHCKVKFTMFARSTTLLSQKCQQHWSVRALSQDYLTIMCSALQALLQPGLQCRMSCSLMSAMAVHGTSNLESSLKVVSSIR